MQFEGKVVIVTGAGSGIGEGIARRFSQENANVVLLGDHERNIKRVARDLPPERTMTVVADVSDWRAMERAVATVVKKWRYLHVMVNNAGIFEGSTVLKTRPEEWERVMALDYSSKGVRVNAVAPSLTWSEMTRGAAKSKPLMKKFHERMPLGRIALPEDIAAVVAFLASDDARFVTGVILPVDGGVTASNGQPAMG